MPASPHLSIATTPTPIALWYILFCTVAVTDKGLHLCASLHACMQILSQLHLPTADYLFFCKYGFIFTFCAPPHSLRATLSFIDSTRLLSASLPPSSLIYTHFSELLIFSLFPHLRPTVYRFLCCVEPQLHPPHSQPKSTDLYMAYRSSVNHLLHKSIGLYRPCRTSINPVSTNLKAM